MPVRFVSPVAADLGISPAMVKPPPRVRTPGSRPAGSSALLPPAGVSCAPAFLSPLGGPGFLVGRISERRPDTQIDLPVRLRADQAVPKCFSFFAGPEFGDDLPCPTVDDDKCLH